MVGQTLRFGEIPAVGTCTQKAKVLFAKAPGAAVKRGQAQNLPQLGVIAQTGVGIQWQMVGVQIDVMRQQQSQALLHPAGYAAVLATPKQPMVNKYGISLGFDCRFYQGTAGGNA